MRAKLLILSGARKGASIPLKPTTTIGRVREADIAFPASEPRISRQHAVIRQRDGEWYVQDSGSTNETLVNGEPIRRARLEDGDVIQFGRGGGPEARFEARAAARAGRRPERSTATREAHERATPGSPRTPSDPAPRPEREPDRSPRRSRGRKSGQRTTQFIREQIEGVSRRTEARLRRALVLVAGLALVLAIGAFALGRYLTTRVDNRFADLFERHTPSVVYVQVRSDTGTPLDEALFSGTGFFVSSDGYIVTNKHVIEPYKFTPEAAVWACHVVAATGRPIEESISISVYIGGTPFRSGASERGDPGLGYSTADGRLRVAAIAPDAYGEVGEPISCEWNGRVNSFAWRPHLMDNNDLALLDATGSDFSFVRMADVAPQTGDPIMVLGFPAGSIPLETNIASPISNTGRVIRTQETIQLDARVIPGNSGGPLINLDGEVTGVTTRGPAEALNMALKIEHARALLERLGDS